MPVQVSYPGVYVEEVPSGVHTIVGVATSVTAFLGRAAFGPFNDPVEVNGVGEYERLFGPVSSAFPMSLTVADFFQNGGSRALVVRLFKEKGGDGLSTLTIGDLTLKAAYPGKLGDGLTAAVRLLDDNDALVTQMKDRLLIKQTDKLFDLDVADTRPGGKVEQHRNLTFVDSLRRLDRVLKADSGLVRWTVSNPLPELKDLGDKETAAAKARKDLDDERAKPTPDPAKIKTLEEALKKAVEDRDKAATAHAANGNDGDDLDGDAYVGTGTRDAKAGLYALEKADLFNLLCIPPNKREETTPDNVYRDALRYCVERRAMLIVDPQAGWTTPRDQAVENARKGPAAIGLTGPEARNAALYFPRIVQSDPGSGELLTSVPCGVIAGIMARTDVQRGAWKAPAGLDANLSGVDGLELNLTDEENGRLNEVGVNVLRSFPVTGRVVWGARTLRGANLLGDEYKYVPVRRLALFLEESLYRGTKWAVFEPNDEPLWAQIRLNVGAFLQNLFRQGAFQGRSPREAYFVKCDKDTTTQNDINLGIVNVLVGFAPLKPAEFVILKIQQLAGQIEA